MCVYVDSIKLCAHSYCFGTSGSPAIVPASSFASDVLVLLIDRRACPAASSWVPGAGAAASCDASASTIFSDLSPSPASMSASAFGRSPLTTVRLSEYGRRNRTTYQAQHQHRGP